MSVGHRIVLELLDPTLGLVAEDLGADILTEVVGRALRYVTATAFSRLIVIPHTGSTTWVTT